MSRARPSDQATLASHEAPAGLRHSAGILRALIERCEKAAGDDALELINLECDLCAALGIDSSAHEVPFSGSIDAALTLLPKGADWRRLTSMNASAYVANPYNAAAQKRHDGYGATVALQICSAALKVRLEPILKAIAIEARRAATENTDAVHESADPKGIAQ